MEYLDIVDQFGAPTGETTERRKAHQAGIRHRTAHIWLIRNQKDKPEVLLQKRSAEKDSFPGCWDTSSAGHVRAGDTPLCSAVREISEELGVSVGENMLTFAGTFDISYEKEFRGCMFRDNEIAFVYVCSCIESNEFSLQREEVSDARWFSLSEVIDRVKKRDPEFCVPSSGLSVLCRFLSSGKADEAYCASDAQ